MAGQYDINKIPYTVNIDPIERLLACTTNGTCAMHDSVSVDYQLLQRHTIVEITEHPFIDTAFQSLCTGFGA
jgi:hypothetical protein